MMQNHLLIVKLFIMLLKIALKCAPQGSLRANLKDVILGVLDVGWKSCLQFRNVSAGREVKICSSQQKYQHTERPRRQGHPFQKEPLYIE